MKREEVAKKILRLVHSYDDEFIIEWETTIRKGFLKFLLKTLLIYSILFAILGFFFIIEKHRFLGYSEWNILPVSLIIGIANGFIASILFWFLSNRRFNDLKEKNYKE